VNTGLMMIPFVGPPLALVLPISIAIFEAPGSALVVTILVILLQMVIVNVVAPKVMSSAVGVHPLLVFVGILAGAKLAGVWGAVFGVPAVAVIAAMAVFYHELSQERRTRGASSVAPEASPVSEPEHQVPDAAPAGPAPLATPPGNVPPSVPLATPPRATAPR
jgi:hypothetical protein